MANNVTIKKGGILKQISKEQWKAMKKNTYGWILHHEISDEVKKIEKKVEVATKKEVKPKNKNGKKNVNK